LDSYHIRGGKKIQGECTVRGAKNAALPILAASIVTNSQIELTGCPEITDVENMLEILRSLGCKTEKSNGNIFVDSTTVDSSVIPARLMKGMRSSVFLMGPLIARNGEVTLSQPGGCEIGARPIDIHVSALKKLGVSIEERDGLLICKGRQLKGNCITLEFPSVGATENAMLAALAADGETIIKNSAREPEIIDLQNFLIACGAFVTGAGSDTIVISGKGSPYKKFHGTSHNIIPDRIEAGTLMAAAAATGGKLFLKRADGSHMAAIIEKFEEAGCVVRKYSDGVYMEAGNRLLGTGFTTSPYPGFPTDMQSQFLAMLTLAEGESLIKETIFENRFKQVQELNKMGADITVSGTDARIKGVKGLKGCRVNATDLRGGAALVIAGLAAEGETIIDNILHIERGYDKLDKVLNALGADIRGITQ
jgi:UDP-N-acetylglucosamine 1-carboxyvinyltransferase